MLLSLLINQLQGLFVKPVNPVGARRMPGVNRRRGSRYSAVPEQLEERQLLAAVSWDGGGGNLLWSNPLNWSGDQLPGPSDDVTLGAAGAVTINYDINGPTLIRSLDLRDSLRITQGSLTVQQNVLSVSGVKLTVTGSTSQFSASAEDELLGLSVDVLAGATASFPAVTVYRGANLATPTLRASGAGSILDLSNVVSLDFSVGHGQNLVIEAQAGGKVDLQRVTQISDEASGVARGTLITADGAGSTVDLSTAANFLDNSTYAGWNSALTARNGGSIVAPALTTLKAVNVTLDGSGTLPIGNWINWTSGIATLSGGNYSFTSLQNASRTAFTVTGGSIGLPALTTLSYGTLSLAGGATASAPLLSNVDGASLLVAGGVTLTLPSVTNYSGAEAATPTLRASGAGSILDLSNVVSLDFSVGHGHHLMIEAQAGGKIDLRRVTQISDEASGVARGTLITADGAGSTVDLSTAANFLDNSTYAGWNSALTARNGGSIVAPALTTLKAVNVTLDGSGTLPIGNWINWTSGIATLSGGNYSFTSLQNASRTAFTVTGGSIGLPALTTLSYGTLSLAGGATASAPLLSNVDGASLLVAGGVTLTLPSVTNYSGAEAATPTLRASGAGSILDLSNVVSLDFSVGHGHHLMIEAQAGGKIDLRRVTQISDEASGVARGTLITADGAGSTVDLSTAANFLDNSTYAGWNSALTARNGGSIVAPALTTLKAVNVTLDGSGTLPIGNWINWTSGIATLSGGNYSFTSLQNASRTAFTVTGGSIGLPALTTLSYGTLSLAGGATASAPLLSNVDGASLLVAGGVTLTLPSVTNYSGAEAATPTLRASGAGSILDLSNVVSLDFSVGHGHHLMIEAQAGGKVDLQRVTQISDEASGVARGTLITADGAGSTVDLSTAANFLDNSTYAGWNSALTARNGGSIVAPALTTLKAVNVTLDGSGTLPIGNWINWTSGIATLSGGNYSFTSLQNASRTAFTVTGGSIGLPALTTLSYGTLSLAGGATASAPLLSNVDGASLLVAGGVTLTLPSVTNYSGAEAATPTLRASGAGSILDLSNVVSLDFSVGHGHHLMIEAQAGGKIDLRRVTQISDEASGVARGTLITADGAGSTVDLSTAANFLDNSTYAGWNSALTARNGGSISLGAQTSISMVTLSKDADSSVFGGLIIVRSGSTVEFSGDFWAGISNQGEVRPLSGPAGARIHGSFSQGASGRLTLEVSGSVHSTDWSRIQVDGTLELNGSLELTRGGDFIPDLLSDYPVLSAPRVSGTFQAVTGGALSGGDFVPVYGSSVVALSRNFNRSPLETLTFNNSQSSQRTFLDVTQVSQSPVEFRLYDPSGKLVTLSNATPVSPNSGDVGPILLSDPGVYELRVFAAPGDLPAYVYNIAAAPRSTQPAGFRRAQTGDISSPGVTDVWEFDTRAGDEISLDVLSIIGAGQRLSFTLQDPDGRTIVSRSAAAAQFNDADFGPVVASKSGTYSLMVDGVGDDVASYQFVMSGPEAPRIAAHTLKGSNAATVNEAWFRFDQAMDTTSFSLAQDLLAFRNATGSLSPTGVRWNDPSTLVLTFAAQPSDVPLFMALAPTILNTSGVPLDQDNDRIPGEATDDQYLAELTLDTTGPRIFLSVPDTSASAPIDRMVFHFTEPVDPSTVSLADIVLFSGPGGSNLKDQIRNILVSGSSLTVFFTEQAATGTYIMTLGPDIADAAGNRMDQNQDGQFGQPADAFTRSLHLLSANLVVDTVASPVASSFGQQSTFTWTVRNSGNDGATGQWWDYVYLSSDDKWDLSDTLIGRQLYDSSTRGVLVGNGGIYTGSLTVPSPGVLPGNYRVIVRSNLLNSIPESSKSDNQLASPASARFDLPILADGVPAPRATTYRGTQYFQIDIPESLRGGSILLKFGTDNTSVPNELYLRKDALPTRATYDHRSQQGLASNQYIIVSNVQPGTWYVLGTTAPDSARTDALGTATMSVDFLAVGQFAILDSYFGKGGTAGHRTIEINGVNLDRSISVSLSQNGTDILEASAYYRISGNRLFATLDLRELSPGNYDVVVAAANGQRVSIPQSFEVITVSAQPAVAVSVVAPPAFRRVFHSPFVHFPVTVQWTNPGVNDLPVPLIQFKSTEPYTKDIASSISGTGWQQTFTGVNSSVFWGTASETPELPVLLPGASGAWTVEVVPRLRGDVGPEEHVIYTPSLVYQDSSPFDWEAARGQLVSFADLPAFDSTLDEFRREVGPLNRDFWNYISAHFSKVFDSSSPSRTVAGALNVAFQEFLAGRSGSISGALHVNSLAIDIRDKAIVARSVDTGHTYGTRTRNDGTFLFADLPPGQYELFQAFDIGGGAITAVALSDQPLSEIMVSGDVQPSVLDIRVLAAGKPVKQALVTLGDESGDQRRLVTNDSWSLEQLIDVGPGRYSVLIEAEEYAVFRDVVEVTIGQGHTILNVQLQNGGGIAGVAARLDGGDLTSLHAIAFDSSGRPHMAAIEGASIRFNHLAAGDYDVFAFHDQLEPVKIADVRVADSEVTDLGMVGLGTSGGAEGGFAQSSIPGWFILYKNALDVIYEASPGYDEPSLEIAWAKYNVNAELFFSWYVERFKTLGAVYIGSQWSALGFGGGGIGLAMAYYTEYFDALGSVGTKAIPEGSAAQIELKYLSQPGVAEAFAIAGGIIQADPFWQKHFDCDDAGVTKTYSVDELTSKLPASRDDIFHAQGIPGPGGPSKRWEYPGIGPGGILAGGNGSFGSVPPGSAYGTKTDLREILGNVTARRAKASSTVTLTSQWRFKVVDAVDFWPGNTTVPYFGNALGGLVPLEQAGMTWDVPFVATWEIETLESEFSVSADQHCDCPEPAPPACLPEGVNPAYIAWLNECFPGSSATVDCGSQDPNDILGPVGTGAEAWVAPARFDYMVRFENDPEKATAPAAVVSIVQSLDADLDLDSFRLGPIAFGQLLIEDSIGKSSYAGRLDLIEEFGIYVDVSAGINLDTGVVTWRLESVDPATGTIPFSPFVGFLPPNLNGTEGQGFVSYSIQPRSDVQNGTRIDATASIIFDQNEPIETPAIFNTIDSDAPSSAIVALNATSFPGVLVRWTGDDANGSGVDVFDIYVAQNGGPFELWLSRTTATEARFLDAEIGSTYQFYSVAYDAVQNMEGPPESADTSTLIVEPPVTTVTGVEVTSTEGVSIAIAFADDVLVTNAIADGSIRNAVFLLSYEFGHIDLSSWSFTYSGSSRQLVVSTPQALPGGTYEVQLNGERFTTAAGAILRGGSSGLSFGIPELGAGSTITAGGAAVVVNSYSSPSVFDYNGDERQDLIVAETLSDGTGRILVFLNTGTETSPVYASPVTVRGTAGDLLVDLPAVGGMSVRLADMSGDGDPDLLIGLPDGRVQYWLNIGTQASPVFALPQLLQAGAAGAKSDIWVGHGANIEIADWDGNGSLDLLVGGNDGRLRLFMNRAVSGTPDFAAPVLIQDGTGDLLVPSARSSVSVFDLNQDGRKDLILGNADGQALYYRNIGSDAEPRFDGYLALSAAATPINLTGFVRSQPFVADVTGDGVADLLLGASDGTVTVFTGLHSTLPESIPQIAGGLFRHVFEHISDSTPLVTPRMVGPVGTDISNPPLISWTPAINADRYHLFLRNTDNGQVIQRFDLTTTSFRPSSTLVDGLYRAWIRAARTDGVLTDWSAPLDFQIGLPRPVTPTLASPGAGSLGSRPQLTWNAVSNAQHYDVWINNLSTGQQQYIRNTFVEATHFVPDIDLPQGRYRAWVRATNTTGASTWSNSVAFLVGAPEPATAVLHAPSNLRVSTQPTFQWSPAARADSYEIWMDNLTLSVPKAVHIQGITATSFSPSSPLAAGIYRVWVRAHNLTGRGEWSDAITVAVGDAAPQKSTILSPTGLVSGERPEITWTSSAGAQAYLIWVDDLTRGVARVIHTTVTTTSYQPASDLAEGEYRVWIQPQSSFGPGAWSLPLTFAVGKIKPARAEFVTPNGLRTQQRPTLEWGTAAYASTYELWIDNRTTGAVAYIYQKGITATEFTPSFALSDGIYRAWVRAGNVYGDGLWSTFIDFAVGNIPPDRVTIIRPTQVFQTRRPTLIWNTAAGADSYEIWVDDLTRGVAKVVHTTVQTTAHKFSSDLASGQYRIWVRAISAHGVGLWSNAVKFEIASSEAIDPDGLDGLFAGDRLLAFLASETSGAARSTVQSQSDNPGEGHDSDAQTDNAIIDLCNPARGDNVRSSGGHLQDFELSGGHLWTSAYHPALRFVIPEASDGGKNGEVVATERAKPTVHS